MKNDNFKKVFLVLLSCFAVAAMGCGTDGCEPKAKYERIVTLSAPMSPDTTFETQTHNGYIDITGTDVTQCSLTATVTGWADTEENAKLLAEAVEIKLVPSGGKLTAKIEKPELTPYQRIGVSFDVTVPAETGADVTTHNGALIIKNLTGQIKGATHNGRVTAEKISGTTELKTHNGEIICKEVAGNTQLETHNGSITCEDASGDTYLRTHNGSAKAFYTATAPPVCNVSMVSHNGSVSLTAPLNLSAKVEASTHNGSINTDLPITVSGQVTKNKLTGTIGKGEGKLYLETYNGSINIK
ncbi:MAG: DUF4097 family beta strand repeat-containing protein [Phycisphaerae bacterium]|nr:DUF4097 family beta strand repeat-containing protein [Phycisphaerae bacterium]MDD5380630.1 DUF4097 family beta strand repeat-containing protein [Phycisphaerae bacterium]